MCDLDSRSKLDSGDASIIYKLVDSGRFDYINVHKHFFGDYHAAGTPDGLGERFCKECLELANELTHPSKLKTCSPPTAGGQGNAAAVKRALELDMGVFGISPFDKGKFFNTTINHSTAQVGPTSQKRKKQEGSCTGRLQQSLRLLDLR